ncbi:hypothetical protein JOM56_003015 [Amanita muscaria]
MVLQAYLNMVPDVHYTIGKADPDYGTTASTRTGRVFWIFVSLMDSHLRPYVLLYQKCYSMQLEVDATLFSRALTIIRWRRR